MLTEAQMAISIFFFPNFAYEFGNDERCCVVWTTHEICAGSPSTAIFSKQCPFQVLQLPRTVQKHDCWLNCPCVWVRVHSCLSWVCLCCPVMWWSGDLSRTYPALTLVTAGDDGCSYSSLPFQIPLCYFKSYNGLVTLCISLHIIATISPSGFPVHLSLLMA